LRVSCDLLHSGASNEPDARGVPRPRRLGFQLLHYTPPGAAAFMTAVAALAYEMALT